MRCLRAVLVVGIAAVSVLLCRGVLVLGFFFNNNTYNNSSPTSSRSSSSSSSTSYNNKLLTLRLGDRKAKVFSPPPTPEAVIVAVHIRNSGQSSSSLSPSKGGEHAADSIEKLAVQRLARDNGVEFSGAGAIEENRRVVDAHVIYENNRRVPHASSQVESWLEGLQIKRTMHFIEASRATERAIIGKPFDVFSGIYGAAVKAKALRWLVDSKMHDRMWVLEPDVVYSGNSWVEFFSLYADDASDLVSVNSTLATKGGRWPHASSCTLCHEGDGRWQTAFLPVFRISKSLAQAVLDGFHKNLTGHHEAFIPTICMRTPGCRWSNIKQGGIYRYRPLINKSEVKTSKKRFKLYHPVKSVEVFHTLTNFN